jgi:hypothetical protein
VNEETVTLIERPYQEVVDDILTAIVGGVVNEPMIFDLRTDFYPLAEPALDVRAITGTVNDKHYAFLKEIDFEFRRDDNAVIWITDGIKPDDNTRFHVDYFRPDSRSPLNDINVGSVTRTLSEAIGREITAVYQQINQAYLSGFIDTAEGKSLDLVVAILGITRKTKDYAIGQATFFRNPASSGNITIPERTLLATEKGDVVFETRQPRTLQRGQVRIDVPIRAGEAFKGKDGEVAAGAISQQAQPIEGINRVTNFDPTILSAEDESDEELRIRAKAIVRALGKGTLAALARVIFEERAKLVEVWDPNSPPTKEATPGTVTLLVESEPERFQSLRDRIHETRAAGVRATVVARYIYFTPRVEVQIGPGLTARGKTQVTEQVIGAIQGYIDGLSSGDVAVGKDLLSQIEGVEDVSGAVIKEATTWQSDIGQPGAAAMVEALLQAVRATPAEDEAALRQALSAAVSETQLLPPTGRRILAPELLQGPDGQTATPEEIEAGEFTVVAEIEAEKWWVYLDMEPADILLTEEEA